MSCNGCRILRKGCSETCVLRTCLQWIESPEAQGHATVFVAKFFGRAGLLAFVSAVPEHQRPALFRSLLFEACGRTINPVDGAVGLLWTGKWDLCQAAVDTVLRGGAPLPVTDIDAGEAEGRASTPCDLEMRLSPAEESGEKRLRKRAATPSAESDEGSVTTSDESGGETRLLKLFI
ncbi:LOB domain-containing protein 38-like [Typha angustifolia]|uniref:LOB domain-containing protein 38-like n=1 Tax=Typha angustifolia TaxID=59011 RepID=UPI003C2AC457